MNIVKKKRASIITYFASANYGAFLQAYALQEFLRQNHITPSIWAYTSKSSKILKEIYKILKPTKISLAQRQYNSAMHQAIITAQKHLQISNTLNNSDLVILGSDEIWNVRNIGAAHDTFMFGKQKNIPKTISYAACAGNSSSSILKKWPHAYRGIRSLDAVSVRDENTLEIVRSFGRTDAILSLDPTFLIDFERIVTKKAIDEPYIFVYSYGLKTEQITSILSLAKEKNCKIIATGSFCPWADNNPAPTPFEWISYIKNAEFVVTSTFHGTVLSIQQHAKFAVVNTGSHKIESVLRRFNLVNHIISQWNTLDYLYSKNLDYNYIDKIIQEEREKSRRYFLHFIGESNVDIETEETIINSYANKTIYAAQHLKQNVLMNSRSGGAFTAISDVILRANGAVYGAAFDGNMSVTHKRAATSEERNEMRGSKYVQSEFHHIIHSVVKDLQDGRQVLVTGTPCQIDAIRTVTEKLGITERLYTLEFICHGVQSPLIFKQYLSLYNNVKQFNFRDKIRFGWRDHNETIQSGEKTISTNIFTNIYNKSLCSRPSCHECPYARFERFADITIGDFWGIEKADPMFDRNDKGVSLIMPNTVKGDDLVKSCIQDLKYKQLKLAQINQPVLKCRGAGTCFPSAMRGNFWNDFYSKGIRYVCQKYSTDNLKGRIKRAIRPPFKLRLIAKKVLKKI